MHAFLNVFVYLFIVVIFTVFRMIIAGHLQMIINIFNGHSLFIFRPVYSVHKRAALLLLASLLSNHSRLLRDVICLFRLVTLKHHIIP